MNVPSIYIVVLVLPTQAHSSKNLGSNVVARVTRLLTQRIMMGINLKTDISDMLLVSDSVIRFWHFCLWAEDKYANSLSRTVYSLISLGPIYYFDTWDIIWHGIVCWFMFFTRFYQFLFVAILKLLWTDMKIKTKNNLVIMLQTSS